MSTRSFRTSLALYSENVRTSADSVNIDSLQPTYRSWTYVSPSLCKHEVSPGGARAPFMLSIARAQKPEARVVYTTALQAIEFKVHYLFGTSLSESFIFKNDDPAPSYAIYLVRRSLSLSIQKHFLQVLAGLAEEVHDMGVRKPDEQFETLLDLLTEDYHVLVLNLQATPNDVQHIEATTPFKPDENDQLWALLKPLFLSLLLAQVPEAA